jgi:hypothetical protein
VTATKASRRTRPWISSLARIGIGARGVVYLLLAYLALDIALHGSSPTQTDAQGALQEVVRQPAGSELLAVLAAGLASYGLWRLFQAVTGQPSPPQSHAVGKRLGWLAIAVVYIGLCVRAIELVAGYSSGSSVSSNPRPWVAMVLGWSGGPEILGVLAVGLMVAGLGLAIWGFVHDYDKDLHFGALATGWRATVRAFGGIGNLVRGFLLVLVGGYLLNAALASNASDAKSVDSSLQALTHHLYGAVLIGFVAAGLLCFAIYSFADARLRSF